MAYTTINKPTDHFNTVLYTGNASGNHAITGVNFRPDFLWIKPRSATDSHRLHSPLLTGSDYFLTSNTGNAEAQNAGCVSSFDSDGFTLNNADSGWNGNSVNYVSWNWKANGQGSSNTDGTINTTYTSVNTTAGFSISSYTGNGVSGATVGHGLGATPKMVIVKELNNASTDWFVYLADVGATKYLKLNGTDAAATTAAAWNDTAPTSSVFSLGNGSDLNGSSDNYIAYCFAEKQGYSKFGRFTGTGSTNGPFIYTGFKPAFVMIKSSSRSTDNWVMVDNKRSTFNPADDALLANTNGGTDTGYKRDFLSNGFKIRESGANQNGSGHQFNYMAFAEAPLVGSNNVPATAR